jgi:hypothetical protein
MSGILGFGHVDPVLADEPADQPGRHRAALGAGDAAGEGRQALLGQQVLRQDFQAIGHGKPRIKMSTIITGSPDKGYVLLLSFFRYACISRCMHIKNIYARQLNAKNLVDNGGPFQL